MVYSGLWDGVAGENYSFNKTNARSPNRYHLARLLKTRGLRELSEVITTMGTDCSPSTTASVSYSRIEHTADPSSNVLGGAATIATHQLMGGDLDSQYSESGAKTARAIDATDVTDVQLFTEGGTEAVRSPPTYPTDASGNGGGGKLD